MSGAEELSEDRLASNLVVFQRVQPGWAVPPSGARVGYGADGWSIADGAHARPLHGPDPLAEADEALARAVGTGPVPSLLVVVGLGLGYLLDALDRRDWVGKVLAFEPEPATVPPLLARRDWQPWLASGRLRVLLGPEYRGAAEYWRWLGDGQDGPVLVVHPAIEALRPREVQQVRALVSRLAFNARANAEARRKFGRRYLLNTLGNLAALATEADAAQLDGAGLQVPAVVVGAGPSLDLALPALREAQHAALIIAADTTLRPLLDAGVVPHLVVAVDPGEANIRHLTELPPCPDTHLVTEASLHPLAMAGFAGRTFLFTVADHEPWPWLQAQGRRVATCRAWGSVLTTTFDVALRLGANPIVFAGADLAFTGGRPYARGVSYEDDWRRRLHWGQPLEQQWQQAVDGWPKTVVPDTTGTPTRSAPHLVAFRDWLVEQMGREPGRRFINATGGGILHGERLEQVSPAAIPALVGAPGRDLRALVRARYRPFDGTQVLDAVRNLVRRAGDRATQSSDAAVPFAGGTAPLAAWASFAPGLAPGEMVQTLARALDRIGVPAGARGMSAEPPSQSLPVTPVRAPELTPPPRSLHPDLVVETASLATLAAALPLVPLPLPARALHAERDGTLVLRFATETGRIVGAVIAATDGALLQDGRALARVPEGAPLAPGRYQTARGILRFKPLPVGQGASPAGGDVSPGLGASSYVLLVPPCVAAAERLAWLAEVAA
ncbi:MAG: motility associated factor glycosyltransferase family protein [Vicinamibacterales bacterium]